MIEGLCCQVKELQEEVRLNSKQANEQEINGVFSRMLQSQFGNLECSVGWLQALREG